MRKLFVVSIVALALILPSIVMAKSVKQIVSYTVTLTKAQTESDPPLDLLQNRAEVVFVDFDVNTAYDFVIYKVLVEKRKIKSNRVRSIVITISAGLAEGDPGYYTQEEVDATVELAEDTFPGYSAAVSYKKKPVK
jgi:hypothetical protein